MADVNKLIKILNDKSKSDSPGIEQEIQYTKSPLYKKRLEKAGVKNVDELISKRVAALEKTKIVPAGQFEYNATTGEENPVITMEKGTSPYTLQHEIVHASKGGGVDIPSYGSPFSASGTQMTPAESWLFYNRNKNLEQKAPETKVINGKPVQVYSDKTMKQKMYEEYTSGGGYYEPDIAKKMYGKKYPTEVHKLSAQENAGDLGAFRKSLFDAGITKTYGENLTPEQINKALENPKIKKEPHTKRLLESFDKKAILDLNNAVAAIGNNQNENQA